MSPPANSDPAQPSADSENRGAERQDTVLLSDIPDSAGYAADSGAGGQGIGPGSETPVTLNLSPAVLSTLSQRYDLLSEAGQGSMGNVYKARDRETGEIVALKLLKPEIASDQAMMERFKNELLFARKITHKNVCRVHEFNRMGPVAYTSMEFVEGESLRSVLNRFGGLAIRKAVNVAQQICSGLKEAHTQGIVHRDLKPENVMIDAQGNVKIMDFGIARSMEAGTRLTGSMVGTPAYMAPEQVSGKPVDYRTDIYSLGLMLYEMFTGAQTFQADTPVAAALKQIREMPPLPHEIDPTIPVPIERAILKCLEKEPAKRFQSVAELEKALTAPSATGTSPGLPAGLAPELSALAAAASTPDLRLGTRRIDRPFASLGPAPKEPRRSPVAWVILILLLLAAGGVAARQWSSIAKQFALLPTPAPLPAPKPPDSAFTIPPHAETSADQPSPANSTTAKRDAAAASANSAAKAPGASVRAAKNSPASVNPASPAPRRAAANAPGTPAKTSAPEVFPRVELPGKKKSAQQVELETVPKGVQQRADKAFGEGKSPDNDVESVYLFVGRYQREEKATETVRKISGYSLPVMAMPRRGLNGQVWVVVTGPFTSKRAPDVMQWLEAQGYRGVHEFQFPFAKGGSKQNKQ
jgi:serine/threonine protein kinase